MNPNSIFDQPDWYYKLTGPPYTRKEMLLTFAVFVLVIGFIKLMQRT